MVVDWDSDSSGLELDRRELVLGWRGWRLALSTKAARVSAPVVPHCLLSASLLRAAFPGAASARGARSYAHRAPPTYFPTYFC